MSRSARQIPSVPPVPGTESPLENLAHRIQPLPSRSRRHLDYESSGSPRPSRSYRRSETESLPVTEFTVPSESNPVTGTAHRQEDSGVRLQNRGDSVTAWGQLHALSGNEVWEITSREETERPPENRLGRSQHAPACPRNRSRLEIWLGRSNRSRAGLAGAWTTRPQARRVRADPTAGRKPKACK